MLLFIDNVVTNPEPAEYMSVLQLMAKGGVVMIPILLFSMISVYVFIDKLIYVIKNAKAENGFSQRLVKELSDGRKDQALLICRNNNSTGRIFENGLSKLGKPVQEIEDVMESAANIEISKMEKHTGYLGIIAGIAPMLGFIGTISGVIKIFYNISLSDNISIGLIADGLYQKMICSATGLIVGVVAYAFYHYLQMQIDRYSSRLHEHVLVFIKSL
ncbi:MAG: MotA/TolQ/ExbB proton channel family protein [Bacteroidales bacterium]|nr:MotA/TolQ/ExbB proton channel family protein [Bacteroidales bacterium]